MFNAAKLDPNADYGGETEAARGYLRALAVATGEWVDWVEQNRATVVRSCKAVAVAFGSPPAEADPLAAGAMGEQRLRCQRFMELCEIAGQLARKAEGVMEWVPADGECREPRAAHEACMLKCLPAGKTCDLSADPLRCGGEDVAGDCKNQVFRGGGCAEQPEVCDGPCRGRSRATGRRGPAEGPGPGHRRLCSVRRGRRILRAALHHARLDVSDSHVSLRLRRAEGAG